MSTASPPSTRPLWVGLFLISATIVGVIAGLLAYSGGANIPTAILTGGGAFAGTVLLLLGLAHFIGLGDDR